MSAGLSGGKCQKSSHTSTSEVYGTADIPIDEEHPLRSSPYSAVDWADKIAESFYLSLASPLPPSVLSMLWAKTIGQSHNSYDHLPASPAMRLN